MFGLALLLCVTAQARFLAMSNGSNSDGNQTFAYHTCRLPLSLHCDGSAAVTV